MSSVIAIQLLQLRLVTIASIPASVEGPRLAEPSLPFIVGVGVIATALGGWSVTRLLHVDRRHHGPASRRMCRALGLSWRERRLLERIARYAGLPSGLSLIVSRGCFDWAVAAAPVRSQSRTVLADIRGRVFDESVTDK